MADHPDLGAAAIRLLPGGTDGTGADPATARWAQSHGTSVAGILAARRGSAAPAICPDTTLLIRSVFSASPECSATPAELAAAITEVVDAGARVVNLSLALLPRPSSSEHRLLTEALDHAWHRKAIVVAATGNQAAIGGSPITRHPGVVPVVAYDLGGQPSQESNLGLTIGQRGVGAPGTGVTSLGADGGTRAFGGTSAAAAFVTGATALLWSRFPGAAPAELMNAIVRSTSRRSSVIPPLLNAWRAYALLK